MVRLHAHSWLTVTWAALLNVNLWHGEKWPCGPGAAASHPSNAWPSLSWDDTSSCLGLCPGLPPRRHVRSHVASLPPPCTTPWWPGPKGWTLWHRRCPRSHRPAQSRNSLRMPSRHGGPHALRRGAVADEVRSTPGPGSSSHSVTKTSLPSVDKAQGGGGTKARDRGEDSGAGGGEP